MKKKITSGQKRKRNEKENDGSRGWLKISHEMSRPIIRASGARATEMEKWRSGGVEEWRSGGVEEWRSGGVEERRSGRVEEWRSGRVEEWRSR
jgi:hypothetical protein